MKMKSEKIIAMVKEVWEYFLLFVWEQWGASVEIV